MNHNKINCGGTRNNIQFILFSDILMGSDCWFYDLNGKTTYFVDKLRGLGEFIILKPTYVNFMKYTKNRDNNDPKHFYAPTKGDISFKMEDLSWENYTNWVYGQIDPNKKFVVIALGQGAYFAKYFANKYHDKCLGLFVLDVRTSLEQNYKKTFHSLFNYDFLKLIVGGEWKSYTKENITNDTINILLDKIVNEENNGNYITLLNVICEEIIISQDDNTNQMNSKTFIYADINNSLMEKMELETIFKKNNTNCTYYYVDDDSYFLIHGKYQNEIYARIYALVNGIA